MERETLLVSACLLGVKCRYDGESKYCEAAAGLLARYDVVAVCPEVLGGLPVPRTPSELRGARVEAADGTDRTAAFRLGAERAVQLAGRTGARKALLKANSPSCGSGKIYDGTFSGRVVPGDGLAAAALKAAGLRVWTEQDLEGL